MRSPASCDHVHRRSRVGAAGGGLRGSPSSHVAQLGPGNNQNDSSSTTAGTALAFSHCMRTHGVPNFPDPDSQGNFPPFQTGVSKQTSMAANEGCKHLLPRGGGTGTPQQRRQKLVFGLKVARCVRSHGFPTFPDPSGSSQGNSPGIDLNSPQFQTAETGCEKQVQKALGLAVSFSCRHPGRADRRGRASAAGCGLRRLAGMTSHSRAAGSFASCMRSHGVPNWPDPNGSGVFDKSKLTSQQLGAVFPGSRRPRAHASTCSLTAAVDRAPPRCSS